MSFFSCVERIRWYTRRNQKSANLNGLSKCAVCDSILLRFIKEKEASGLVSKLGSKTYLNKRIISFKDIKWLN